MTDKTKEGECVRTIYLVYGWDCYEYPCSPIKTFASESEAGEFVRKIDNYQNTRPSYPADDAPYEEFEAAQLLMDAWIDNHPAKNHHWREGFSVMQLELKETT